MTALLIYFFISLFISFLCSLLESVILSVSHAHLAVLVKAGSKRGKLMSSLKEDINRPLSAILTINTIAHTLGAAGVGAQTYIVFGNEYVALSSIILTFCVLFFSEIIPKTLGANYTKSLVGFSAYTIRILIFIVFPMVFIGEKISKFLKRNDKDESKASREELIAMAELSEDEGAIDSQEGDIIENLMKLDNISAEEVMTPRSVIFSLEDDDTVGRVKVYESIVKGDNIPEPGIPESFKVLLKEMQSLCLNVEILSAGEEISMKDISDEYVKTAETLGIDMTRPEQDEAGV